MSQLELNKISKEIIDHAEKTLVPDRGLPKVVDDYFIQRLKEDEMQHAEVNAGLYDGLRKMVKTEVVPLYEQYRVETDGVRQRRQKRKIWQYVVGTVAVCEILEALLTRGRSFVPQAFIPSAILYSFIGFIIYTATQYFDDLYLTRARKRMEKSLEGLETRVMTDTDYDQRRQLLDSDVLRAEAMEILAHYEHPEDFWRDYFKVRKADPTVPGEVRQLDVPAFEKFLKFHVNDQFSELARQQRFDRLFVEAHEAFINRDRQNYVLNHLKSLNSEKS